jgi:hypothetical protein
LVAFGDPGVLIVESRLVEFTVDVPLPDPEPEPEPEPEPGMMGENIVLDDEAVLGIDMVIERRMVESNVKKTRLEIC